MGIIYKITNKVNRHFYIGQTIVSSRERFRKHRNSMNQRKTIVLYKAFRKYGIESFVIEELEQCNRENLLARERFYIKQLKPQYNMTAGGEGAPPFKITPKRIAAWERQKGTTQSKKTCKLRNAVLRNMIWINNGESNRRIDKTEPLPNGWKKGRLKSWSRLGSKQSPETRLKMSMAKAKTPKETCVVCESKFTKQNITKHRVACIRKSYAL
jgi:group I intron endonuclease